MIASSPIPKFSAVKKVVLQFEILPPRAVLSQLTPYVPSLHHYRRSQGCSLVDRQPYHPIPSAASFELLPGLQAWPGSSRLHCWELRKLMYSRSTWWCSTSYIFENAIQDWHARWKARTNLNTSKMNLVRTIIMLKHICMFCAGSVSRLYYISNIYVGKRNQIISITLVALCLLTYLCNIAKNRDH